MKVTFSIRLPIAVALLLVPVSLAWSYFDAAATQDGPSHLAAAKIANDWILQSLGRTPAGSVFETFRLQFEPVPNWSGQALGMALCAALPDRLAEIAMNLAGVWIPAISLAWLAGSILASGESNASERGPSWPTTVFHALWISTLAMNALWSFGFTSFLLGLGVAWAFLSRMCDFARFGGFPRWFALTFCWCATFVCHLVAFAIGGIVAGWLLLLYPNWSIARRAAIAASLACAAPLCLRYRMSNGGSPMEPIWEHLSGSELLSIANWGRQIGWIDPVSLHAKSWHPFTGHAGLKSIVLQPVVWLALALILIAFAAIRSASLRTKTEKGISGDSNCIPDDLSGRAGALSCISSFMVSLRQRKLPESTSWTVAGSSLAILGTIGPDSLGAEQGHYLPQRFCLAALCMVTLILTTTRIRIPVLAVGFLTIAWVMQTSASIDFARRSHRITQPVRSNRDAIRSGDRILALIDAEPWPYRSNPRLHFDALLVTSADDLVSWNLYEAAHPYFPLRFRSIVPGISPAVLESYSLAVTGEDLSKEAEDLASILAAAEGRADIVAILMDRSSPRRKRAEKAIDDLKGWHNVRNDEEIGIYRRTATAARSD